MKTASVLVIALSLLHPALCLYSKKGDVQILNSKDFVPSIKGSDKITIVEFYAPWCGHCKNLVPIYNKVATSLKGLVNVAAIDCDDETNKRICGKYDVKGFPTIKMMRPKKDSKGRRDFSVEDYNGERSVKAITQYAASIMPSRVQKLNSQTFEKFMSSNNETVKVILFTKKGSTSSTYKALSTSFDDLASFGQVRDNQAAIVDSFGVVDFPKVLLLPGGKQDAIAYDGPMQFSEMKDFVSSYVSVATASIHDSKMESETEKSNDATKQSKKSCPMKNKLGDEEHTRPITAETSNGKPALVELSSVERFSAECIDEGLTSALVGPVAFFRSSGIPSQSDTQVKFFGYDSETGSQLKARFGLPQDRLLFVNGKKRWYIPASTELSTREEALEFLDNVRQGAAGKKIKLEPYLGKEEL